MENRVACVQAGIFTNILEDSEMSQQDASVMRTMTGIFAGLFALFLVMVFAARMIVY